MGQMSTIAKRLREAAEVIDAAKATGLSVVDDPDTATLTISADGDGGPAVTIDLDDNRLSIAWATVLDAMALELRQIAGEFEDAGG